MTAGSAGATSGCGRPRRQPVRAPGVRAQDHRRHEHPRGARDRGSPRLRLPRGARRVRPGASPGSPSAPTSSRWRSPSPRASPSPSTATSCAGRTGRCGSASTSARVRCIYQVAFDDPRHSGRERDVAYRMSFAEMVVPYRDPGFDHYRRTAFDIGEWGLGYMTTSLELGCDCLGEIVYVDAVVPDSPGEPQVIPQAICLHEEDNAVLWKHVDAETGAAGPADASDGGLGARHGRQLRVPDLLALLRRRQHRVRGPGHRPDGHHPAGERRRLARRTARWSTSGRTRRSTSTSWSPSSIWTSTARTTPSSRSTRSPRRSPTTTRTGWR